MKHNKVKHTVQRKKFHGIQHKKAKKPDLPEEEVQKHIKCPIYIDVFTMKFTDRITSSQPIIRVYFIQLTVTASKCSRMVIFWSKSFNIYLNRTLCILQLHSKITQSPCSHFEISQYNSTNEIRCRGKVQSCNHFHLDAMALWPAFIWCLTIPVNGCAPRPHDFVVYMTDALI